MEGRAGCLRHPDYRHHPRAGHAGSRECQILTNHRNSVARPKHGACCGIWSRRLDRQHQPLLIIDPHIEDVHVRNIEDRIGPCLSTRTPTTHKVRHRRGFLSESLVDSDPEGPDTLTCATTRQLRRHPLMLISEESVSDLYTGGSTKCRCGAWLPPASGQSPDWLF
jgi:hypothetical protein